MPNSDRINGQGEFKTGKRIGICLRTWAHRRWCYSISKTFRERVRQTTLLFACWGFAGSRIISKGGEPLDPGEIQRRYSSWFGTTSIPCCLAFLFWKRRSAGSRGRAIKRMHARFTKLQSRPRSLPTLSMTTARECHGMSIASYHLIHKYVLGWSRAQVFVQPPSFSNEHEFE